jgi:hypothetical protein
MERLTVSFDISESRIDYIKASEIRKEVSSRLDTALRASGAGKWAGGSYTKDMIEIFLMVNDHEQTLPVIQSALKDHWLLPLMKVKQG